MEFEYCLLGCMVFMAIVSIVLITLGCIENSEIMFSVGCGLCIVSGLLIFELGSDWNKRTIDHADDFFATRDEVYKCDGLKPLQCDYKLKVWREDSVMWANKVKNIMEGK